MLLDHLAVAGETLEEASAHLEQALGVPCRRVESTRNSAPTTGCWVCVMACISKRLIRVRQRQNKVV